VKLAYLVQSNKKGINLLNMKIYDAADWSSEEDSFTQMFYNQNVRQFWLPEEISLNSDLLIWKSLSQQEKDTYKKALAGLTLLDTEQGNTGMPLIAGQVKGHQRKAVLNFMAMMENAVHAKSYSNIFMTLAPSEEIKDLFQWVKDNKYLQKKASIIVDYYNDVKSDDELSLYRAMVASVYLESFLFYSGFYYPLLCYGQGRMMQSGEIINLIIRDEAIHGVYIGLLAQEIYNKQSDDVKNELNKFSITLLKQLYENELGYTEDLYDSLGFAERRSIQSPFEILVSDSMSVKYFTLIWSGLTLSFIDFSASPIFWAVILKLEPVSLVTLTNSSKLTLRNPLFLRTFEVKNA